MEWIGDNMEDIILKSGKIVVTEILKKTTAGLFRNIEIYDVLYIEYKIESLWGGYQPSLKICNLTKDEERYITPTQLTNFLGYNFDYVIE